MSRNIAFVLQMLLIAGGNRFQLFVQFVLVLPRTPTKESALRLFKSSVVLGLDVVSMLSHGRDR